MIVIRGQTNYLVKRTTTALSTACCAPALSMPVTVQSLSRKGVSWLVLGVLVLALITRGFKASPPEMAATEKATVEAAA